MGEGRQSTGLDYSPPWLNNCLAGSQNNSVRVLVVGVVGSSLNQHLQLLLREHVHRGNPVVLESSRVQEELHGRVSARLSGWIGAYRLSRRCVVAVAVHQAAGAGRTQSVGVGEVRPDERNPLPLLSDYTHPGFRDNPLQMSHLYSVHLIAPSLHELSFCDRKLEH